MKIQIGQRFGRLTVMSKAPLDKNHEYWFCKCDCGSSFVTTSHSLTNDRVHSCGCVNSNGELKISNLLTKGGYVFQKQKSFHDCINDKTGKVLLFDFYLPDYNCCIEYDGEQHFKEKQYFKDTLADRQYRDTIKSTYCINHNIKLVRIPYWDYDKINSNYLVSLLEGGGAKGVV